MALKFKHNGWIYETVPVTSNAVSKEVVCVDSAHYNTSVKIRSRFAEPPVGTRSAFQRIMFPEYIGEGTAWERACRPEEVGRKEREEAVQHFDRLQDRYKGFYIPHIDHRWQSRVVSLMQQNKLVYTNHLSAVHLVVRHRDYGYVD
jgi:hypothetical protein